MLSVCAWTCNKEEEQEAAAAAERRQQEVVMPEPLEEVQGNCIICDKIVWNAVVEGGSLVEETPWRPHPHPGYFSQPPPVPPSDATRRVQLFTPTIFVCTLNRSLL